LKKEKKRIRFENKNTHTRRDLIALLEGRGRERVCRRSRGCVERRRVDALHGLWAVRRRRGPVERPVDGGAAVDEVEQRH
jgi:hypothetical protein